MISLVIPPKDQISRVQKMLQDGHGTASHNKSRVNRLSVLSAITSARKRLKLCNKVPKNGLNDGKEKKMSMQFEPFKPINASLYLCDNKFHVNELLKSDVTFGFIIIDGNCCLYVLAGSANFKNDLFNSNILDGRLKAASYGGENGFNQSIELSKDALANVKFVREKKLLMDFMH
ncbi:eukaryotic peptide chain release factor subunit 1 [Reticulomyxa filosa]|uniref:Eukaryotic peptide chain release factor subunit 1 n=1 Tax=Reticulomyxa filosa TaxID=46433 RepID=X6LG09_RETFI|nr:eukaryotic peptide chain release factor subunit 1 [Reticulomyxa filosa]|eukprot:ETO00893.1 eukaryotic peptide chain release factor subunit 1 [Reticulomyxa filosa]